ncbi:MAG TPA: hypothetical protein VHV08_05045 [Pirellulales bacterium]|jgi:hypothetical protein|nr:hypothetical protein [Pirellulales bacterium]
MNISRLLVIIAVAAARLAADTRVLAVEPWEIASEVIRLQDPGPQLGPPVQPVWPPKASLLPPMAAQGSSPQEVQAPEVVAAPLLRAAPLLPDAPRLVEGTWYTRIDYFHWNERIDGSNFVREDGPLWTLGYQRRIGPERFRAELFGSKVHYSSGIQFDDGTVEPLSSMTDYLGLRAEYELMYEPVAWPHLSVFGGIGTRFWIRNLPDIITDMGDFVRGYQETWWTFYPYMGLERRRTLTPDVEFYARGRIGVMAFTYEHLTIDQVTLFPRPGITGQLEAGIRGPRLFLSAYFEAFQWQQSAVVRDWLQPNSRMFVVGLKTGFSF